MIVLDFFNGDEHVILERLSTGEKDLYVRPT
jgi:hypothetical protein